ncbi:hypothetical protein KP509_11G077200 [Ceratopteris richardii]|uniref:lipoyl(octanoyl) transferase n=1 Tax=Ceratopteris richardii TaxID=49495 RepID=A0A8T2TWW5_CERRI|nr:hypothetical protein KP509_11G077200 [Ceratopteris richardii]
MTLWLESRPQELTLLSCSSHSSPLSFPFRRSDYSSHDSFRVRFHRNFRLVINAAASNLSTFGLECYDLYDHCIPYKDAWTWQKSLVKTRMDSIKDDHNVDDAIIMLQHTPVYTMGTRRCEEYLLVDKDQLPCDLYHTERGGEVTYHGPGQLVMYPILNLRHFQMDIHWYIRSLEEVVIRALWSAVGIEATRKEGLTGVWVADEKVAAIGVRVSRWITYHGLALNVTTDLSPFKKIVPCGIRDYSVGCVLDILHRRGQYQTVTDQSNIYGDRPEYLLNLLHESLLEEFCEVFKTNVSCLYRNASILSTKCGLNDMHSTT